MNVNRSCAAAAGFRSRFRLRPAGDKGPLPDLRPQRASKRPGGRRGKASGVPPTYSLSDMLRGLTTNDRPELFFHFVEGGDSQAGTTSLGLAQLAQVRVRHGANQCLERKVDTSILEVSLKPGGFWSLCFYGSSEFEAASGELKRQPLHVARVDAGPRKNHSSGCPVSLAPGGKAVTLPRRPTAT